ncbi:hypothetical protein [Caudoviricetes sp.]|nr:hypothetical protein [Caudoviricetes sp.]
MKAVRVERRVGHRKGYVMYIHEEIQQAVLPLLEKYDLEVIDLIGELNHAAWELSVLNKNGIAKLIAKLKVSNVQIEVQPAVGLSRSNAGLGSAKGDK